MAVVLFFGEALGWEDRRSSLPFTVGHACMALAMIVTMLYANKKKDSADILAHNYSAGLFCALTTLYYAWDLGYVAHRLHSVSLQYLVYTSWVIAFLFALHATPYIAQKISK